MPPELLAEALRRFAGALEPLRSAGRLGLVLYQFPRYVYPSRGSFGYLEWLADFDSSVPPVAVATADVAEVRFHGRNAEVWEARGVSAAERHFHDYRREELAEWVPRIKLLHDGGRPVHLLMNNCYAGHCVRNARTLARLLADALE